MFVGMLQSTDIRQARSKLFPVQPVKFDFVPLEEGAVGEALCPGSCLGFELQVEPHGVSVRQ